MLHLKSKRHIVTPRPVDRADLLWHVEQLEQQLDALCLPLRDRPQAFAWCAGEEEHDNALRSACAIYRRLSYQDGQGETETIKLAGLLGIDSHTLEAAHAVNHAKDALRACTRKFHTRFVNDQTTHGTQHLTPYLRYLLARIGRARMNTQQAYRHIQIVEHPVHAGFTWARIRKVARLPRDKLLRMLEEFAEDTTALSDLDRVHGVSDTVFALVNGPDLQIRANLMYPDQAQKTRQVNVSMPLLYRAMPGQAAPRITKLPKDQDKGKRNRKAVRLREQRFLECLNVYRYRDGLCPGEERAL